MQDQEPIHCVIELTRPDGKRTEEDQREVEDRIEVYAARARMRLPLFPRREP